MKNRIFGLLLLALPTLCWSAGLTLSLTSSSSAVDLSALGVDNWAEWEGGSYTPSNTKSGGAGTISATYYVTDQTNTATGLPVTISWTGGTPVASGSSTSGLLNEGGWGQGYSVTFDADTSTREARIFFGGFDSETNISCHLSDASATVDDQTLAGVSNGFGSGYAVVTYSAASAGQTLTCDVWLSNNLGGSSGGRYTFLQAATVKAASAAPTDDASFMMFMR